MKKLEAPNSLIGYADLDEEICDDLVKFYQNDTMFHIVEGITFLQIVVIKQFISILLCCINF